MGGTPTQRYRAGMADMLTGAVDFIPGVGDAVGVADTAQAIKGGNYGTAAMLGGATMLGMLPVVGDAASGAIKKAANFIDTLPGRNELNWWIDGGQDAVERGFQEEPFILLDKLYIDPQNRGQGAARQVLKEGLQDMADRHPGMEVKLLAEPLDESTDQIDLVRLYESVGFDVDNYQNGMSGIPMSMRLPSPSTAKLPYANSTILRHNSWESAPIDVSARYDGTMFDGIFASSNGGMGGDKIHAVVLEPNEIMNHFSLKYDLPYEDYKKAAKEVFPKWSDEQIDRAFDYASEDKNVFNESSDDWADLFGSDADSASWSAQGFRGAVARKLGYKGVEMLDETGTSVQALEGVRTIPAREGESFDDLERRIRSTTSPSALEAPLDMSSGARMQRAAEQGKTADVYHGTYADYSSFDPERLDIGLHVGTPEQAANRLRDTANPLIGGRSSYYASGANILPLKANLGNSLTMPDVGDWGNSLQVLEELKNVKGFDKSQIEALIDDAEQAMSSASLKGMTWTETPENKTFLNEIKDIILNSGYDSIKYQNAVENDYYDLADITDEAKNIKRELGYGLDYFEQRVRARMPQVPDPQAPDATERLQEFINAKFDDYILPEEAQAMDSLKAQMREVSNNPRYLKDNNSYIILDPAQNVSSRFAAFDPTKRGSGNLMAGAAGATVGLSALRNIQREDEPQPD